MYRTASVLTAFLAACGGGSNLPSAVKTVGPAGATLQAGTTMLTIPAGALTDDTQVTLREAEPRHDGRAARIEVEPHGRSLGQAARLSVQVDDTNARVKLHGKDDALVETEIEDRNHGRYKTSMSELGEVEVEVEHARACSPACAAGQECDDGVCKAHVENEHAAICDPVCASGQECDDGACKTHGEVETEHGGGGAPGACTPACATGLECDNGICKPHG